MLKWWPFKNVIAAKFHEDNSRYGKIIRSIKNSLLRIEMFHSSIVSPDYDMFNTKMSMIAAAK